MNIPGLFLLLSFLAPGIIFSQETIHFHLPETVALKFKPVKFRSEKEKADHISDAFARLYGEGYLTARLDSAIQQSNTLHIYITSGQRYKWLKIKKEGNTDEGMLSAAGVSLRKLNGSAVSAPQLESMMKNILSHYENNGYPFASAGLDSITISDNELQASLRVDQGPAIYFDSIIIKGDAAVHHAYLHSFTGIRPGDAYNHEKLEKLGDLLQEVPFLTVEQPPEVVFTTSATKLILYLNHRKASNFDGILGVLPDDNLPGRILLTGDIRLKLLSAFNRGELIDLRFKKLQTQTQDMQAGFNYPYLFGTPLGADLLLQLYKRDTSFINIRRSAALQYSTGGYNHINLFADIRSTTLLDNDLPEGSASLPDYAGVSTSTYGLGMHRESLDYRFNPRKGYTISFRGGTGIRTVSKHPAVDDTVYQNMALKNMQYSLALQAQGFIPLFSRSTIKIAVDGAWLGGNSIFRNEMYRIGGFGSLRGFDEESIFASAYTIATGELRYLLERNAYAYVFWNGAWYEQREPEHYHRDTPYGVGAGVSFETRAGIFSIAYALGRQEGNPFELRSGKIHFGISSFF